MDLSVVIPVRNEAGNIAPLVAEIAAALDGIAAYEIVYVDDGSEDSTAAEIRRTASRPAADPSDPARAQLWPERRDPQRGKGSQAGAGSRRSTATARTIPPTSRPCGVWRRALPGTGAMRG